MALRFRELLNKGGKHGASLAAAALGSASFAAAATVTLLDDDVVHATAHPWDHTGLMSAYDCASLRRGFQVYRQVCASCHSLKGIHYRNLAGVTHTDEELMAMAEEVDFVDGPNDEGEMFERPGKLTDHLPSPYPNDETGRMANGGALPPDLTLMVKSRHAGSDYLFSLLTGYCDPPDGKSVMAGLYYNPYFPGGAIAMPPPLSDGGVEYEDGTVATISQQAKDVSQFLHWASEPEADVRKKQAFQYLTALAFMTVVSGYYKRFKWSPLKTRQISYLQPSDPLMKLQKKKLAA